MNQLDLELYLGTEEHGFTEANVVRQTVTLGSAPIWVEIGASDSPVRIVAVRLDFGNRPGRFLLYDLSVHGDGGKTLTHWDHDPDFFQDSSGVRIGIVNQTAMVECTSEDPQVVIPIDFQADARAITISLRVSAIPWAIGQEPELQIGAAPERDATLPGPLNHADQTLRRLLDQVLIEQDEINRGLLETRNASRNLTTSIAERLASAEGALISVEALRSTIDRLELQLAERDRRFDGRNETMEGNVVERVETLDASLTARLESLRSVILESDHQVGGAVEAKLSEIASELNQRETHIIDRVNLAATRIGTRQDAQYYRLDQFLETEKTQREIHNKTLESKIDRVNEYIDRLAQGDAEASLDNLERRLLNAFGSNEARLQVFEQTKSQLDAINRELGCLGLPFSATLQEISRLRNEALRDQTIVTEVLGSTSWRITRPIRVLKRFLASLLGRN